MGIKTKFNPMGGLLKKVDGSVPIINAGLTYGGASYTSFCSFVSKNRTRVFIALPNLSSGIAIRLNSTSSPLFQYVDIDNCLGCTLGYHRKISKDYQGVVYFYYITYSGIIYQFCCGNPTTSTTSTSNVVRVQKQVATVDMNGVIGCICNNSTISLFYNNGVITNYTFTPPSYASYNNDPTITITQGDNYYYQNQYPAAPVANQTHYVTNEGESYRNNQYIGGLGFKQNVLEGGNQAYAFFLKGTATFSITATNTTPILYTGIADNTYHYYYKYRAGNNAQTVGSSLTLTNDSDDIFNKFYYISRNSSGSSATFTMSLDSLDGEIITLPIGYW